MVMRALGHRELGVLLSGGLKSERELMSHCWFEGGGGHVRRNVGGLRGLRGDPS